jgi:hypothetical protein
LNTRSWRNGGAVKRISAEIWKKERRYAIVQFSEEIDYDADSDSDIDHSGPSQSIRAIQDGTLEKGKAYVQFSEEIGTESDTDRSGPSQAIHVIEDFTPLQDGTLTREKGKGWTLTRSLTNQLSHLVAGGSVPPSFFEASRYKG